MTTIQLRPTMIGRILALGVFVSLTACTVVYAQDPVSSESTQSPQRVRVVTDQVGSAQTNTSLAQFRRRLDKLRGVGRRVVYPIIIVLDEGRFEGVYPDGGVTPAFGAIDTLASRALATAPLDSSRTSDGGDPRAGQDPLVADDLAAAEGTFGGVAPNAQLKDAQLDQLRNDLIQLRLDAAADLNAQSAETRRLNLRLSELERDVDLLLALRATTNAGSRDTLVIAQPDTVILAHTDTVFQRLETPGRVDTVFVISEPGPPTVVEVERALLDKGLFETVDVLFEFDKATLLPVSEQVLESVGQALRNNPELSVEVGGHTDSVGSDEYNLDLSSRRANAVRDHLIERQQIDGTRITAAGYGESRPVSSNATPTGRALNRRVDFRVR